MSWEQDLAKAYRSPNDLVKLGLISKEQADAVSLVAKQYQFLLSDYYASLIDPNDPDCPIRLQAIPALDEVEVVEREVSDPLQDLKHQPVERVTHRYRNRVLLHLTPNCSMYCRFCFRKTLLNGLKEDLFSGGLEAAFRYLAETVEISEVIFSGGDPFMVTDDQLRRVIAELSGMSHVKRIRFHTRVPVTLPSRVTSGLIEVLGSSRFHPVVVTHFNHPKEITSQAQEAIRSLKQVSLLLNQSVLLKRVNDSVSTLTELSERLFDSGVLPYYLHQLDPSRGTHHFFVEPKEGKRLWERMKEGLPGYLVPRYVVDQVGIPFKKEVEGF